MNSDTLNKTNAPMSENIQNVDEPTKKYEQMPFGRINFIMMGACVLMIIIGFALMSGGGAASETEFNPEIFSTRRLVVGPTIAFLGFLCMAFAIIWTPRSSKK